MRTSNTFISVRRDDWEAVPFLAVADIAPELLATALLVLMAVFVVALSFIFAARRPSPNHKLVFDLLARMEQIEQQHPPATSPLSHRMRA